MCPAPAVAGATYSPEKATYGMSQSVLVQCGPLYDYSGDESKLLTCGTDGKWQGTATCTR